MCEMCKVVSLNFFIAIKSKVLTRPRNIYDERYKVKVHRKNKLRTEKKKSKNLGTFEISHSYYLPLKFSVTD